MLYLFCDLSNLQPWLLCSGWSKEHFRHRLMFRDYALDQHWDIAKCIPISVDWWRQKANMCIACVFYALLWWQNCIQHWRNLISTFFSTLEHHYLNSTSTLDDDISWMHAITDHTCDFVCSEVMFQRFSSSSSSWSSMKSAAEFVADVKSSFFQPHLQRLLWHLGAPATLLCRIFMPTSVYLSPFEHFLSV